jgi:DNA repair exonuclease SbcCD nuclease subunit
MRTASERDLVLAHSSDLHLSAESGFDALSILRRVLDAALEARADLLILAGDTFDHNRQPSDLIDRAMRILSEFPALIVILPGNHDPLTADSVYRRADLAAAANVSVLGLTVDEAAVFPVLGLEVCGRAHLDYFDMPPLPAPRRRSTRWRIAAAHGHYVEEPGEPGRLLGSWLIRSEDLIAAGADYIALGHWNRSARVGGEEINAYYSGSPEFAGTFNLVRLMADGSVEVRLKPLHGVVSERE